MKPSPCGTLLGPWRRVMCGGLCVLALLFGPASVEAQRLGNGRDGAANAQATDYKTLLIATYALSIVPVTLGLGYGLYNRLGEPFAPSLGVGFLFLPATAHWGAGGGFERGAISVAGQLPAPLALFGFLEWSLNLDCDAFCYNRVGGALLGVSIAAALYGTWAIIDIVHFADLPRPTDLSIGLLPTSDGWIAAAGARF